MSARKALPASLLMGLGLLGSLAFTPSAPAAPSALTIFRVDVSQYPSVGLVVTVPSGRALSGNDFTVAEGDRVVRPGVRQLSPNDVELAVAPASALGPAAFRAEQAGATRFLAALPAGERAVVVNPATPGVLPGGLSGDPAPAITTLAGLASGSRDIVAARLETALSAFTAGPRVRRTAVLAVSSGQSLSGQLAARFRAELAASGTSLYVLDATSSGAPGYDALAAGSGGFAVRIPAAADWTGAFARISASLGEQYYLHFTATSPLPGEVRVSVKAPSRESAGVASLPAHNPVAPPLLSPSALVPPGPLTLSWDAPFVLLASLLIVIGLTYGLVMLLASRRAPRPLGRHRRMLRWVRRKLPQGVPSDLFFVFLMPCLNEEKVIRNSLDRLLSVPGSNFVILVVDDGSDDGTADAVAGAASERVWLLRRRPPHARQGKGEALNAAVRYLIGSRHLDGHDPDQVIVVVMDADGRLDPDAIEKVTPYFADPATGAVQIGVRINNRQRSWLARMQDMEFVIYTEIFQRGKRHLGSVGLGGNGQFMRLSAMLSLGLSPWSRSLTDDLDLGVRMLAAGWRNEYCHEVAVHQQGVVELRRLIRQRSRWFQGHLQSWRLIPLVLRNAPGKARTDLIYHLSSPAVLLIASLLSASFLISVANALIIAAHGTDPLGLWIVTTYALTFGPAMAFSSVYWSREHRNGVGVLRTILLAHLYVCYGMMWYASGWWAFGRTLRGRTGWAKTDRVAESPALSTPALSPAPARLPASAMALAPLAPAALAPAALAPAAPHAPFADRGLADGLSALATASLPVVTDHRESPPPRRRRRWRGFAIAVAVAGLAAGVSVPAAAIVRHRTPPGWVQVFNGYGTTSVTGSGASVAVKLDPARATARDVSHAALVVSARDYGDFAATAGVRTLSQLRQGAAGKANPWEVGWFIWHYTSDQHFYALTLEPGGWVLSKQDPAYPGGERFLASGLAPRFQPGRQYTVGIVQTGAQMTVSADGQMLTRFTDTSRPYLSGAAGFYCEDALVTFDNIRIQQLAEPPDSR